MPEKFDCIVVGAGPAGTACAYELAKAGVNVLLLERGEYPGAKTSWAVYCTENDGRHYPRVL